MKCVLHFNLILYFLCIILKDDSPNILIPTFHFNNELSDYFIFIFGNFGRYNLGAYFQCEFKILWYLKISFCQMRTPYLLKNVNQKDFFINRI